VAALECPTRRSGPSESALALYCFRLRFCVAVSNASVFRAASRPIVLILGRLRVRLTQPRWLKVNPAKLDWLPAAADDPDSQNPRANYVVLTASARMALTPRAPLQQPVAATPSANDSPGKRAMLSINAEAEQTFTGCTEQDDHDCLLRYVETVMVLVSMGASIFIGACVSPLATWLVSHPQLQCLYRVCCWYAQTRTTRQR
jgi:hypothetical protein